jgi:hypothetical protein
MLVRSQIVQQHGIEAELYLPSQAAAYPIAVLVVAGSSGGLRHREVAHRLASDGIPALALAYFAYGTLPLALRNIPLEYFFQAIQYIGTHPELCGARLIAMGSSRGGELVLQLAAMYRGLRGVIATSPSHARWGATGTADAAWTAEGRPLPFVHPIESNTVIPRSYAVAGTHYVMYRDWYVAQLAHNPSVEAATIPIEWVNGPILLFSGTDDQLWPATLFADQIEARAQRYGFAYPIMNVQYQNAGHVFPLPGQTPILHTMHPALGSGIAYGGTPDGIICAAAARWSRIVSFLHNLD